MTSVPLSSSFNENEEGLPKAALKALIKEHGMEPGINTALFIAAGSLGKKKTWTGSDYGEHWIRVSAIGHGDVVSLEEKIVGVLHDVVEDSDWTIEDLKEIGYSGIITEGVRSVTKLDGEKYLDAAKRASINPIGSRVKMRDNKDNMDLTRSEQAATDKQKFLYHISYMYQRAAQQHIIAPNSPIWEFLEQEKFAKLVTKENIGVIARATIEPMPQHFAQKFMHGDTAPASHPV